MNPAKKTNVACVDRNEALDPIDSVSNPSRGASLDEVRCQEVENSSSQRMCIHRPIDFPKPLDSG